MNNSKIIIAVDDNFKLKIIANGNRDFGIKRDSWDGTLDELIIWLEIILPKY